MDKDTYIPITYTVCTMEYYSAIKNEIMLFAATWIELEIIIHEQSNSERERH